MNLRKAIANVDSYLKNQGYGLYPDEKALERLMVAGRRALRVQERKNAMRRKPKP